MTAPLQLLCGFHAVAARLKVAPDSIAELYVDATRHDARMRQMLGRAAAAGVRPIACDAQHLARLAGGTRHQGVVARVRALPQPHSLDDLLDAITDEPPLLLLLDGVTDPHNLGACLRTADAAGVHAVIAPRDRAAGINATVAKAASGAADTVPYFMVTNLARTMCELKELGIWITGTSDAADASIYASDFRRPTAIALGAEGAGLRRLTAERCDALARIPMRGAVESLNVSVACGVCLYEARRQRSTPLL